MLKKFSSPNGKFSMPKGGKFADFCNNLCPAPSGLWRLKRWAWPCFALAAFLLFLYLLRRPGWYLMLTLFLQVVGLLLSLYRPGC